jgi:glycerate dehydrogenase
MRIVVLDGHTLNPGDLSWQALRMMGETFVYDRTRPEELLERAEGADAILTNVSPITADNLRMLPRLRYIGVMGTGWDHVDVEAAARRGIVVTNAPEYGTASVAQFVFALLLELCQHVGLHNEAVQADEWMRCEDFSFTRKPLIELEGKTMGIIGYGRIGKQTASIAKAFGMKVLAATAGGEALPAEEGCTVVSLRTLLAESDVVSLHCPLLPGTARMINRDTLSLMKRSAFLINTARGGLIVERDLADALGDGLIAGAALDVLSAEPPEADHPLVAARNCFITPHIAWATREARARLMGTVVDNMAAFLSGHPSNKVAPVSDGGYR